jgi:glycolate oxidase
MNEALLTGLAAIVGPRWVRQRRAELATYTMDGLPTHESYPGVVVLPGSRDELIAVMKQLHATRTPFVARGAGTGLSGGALAGGDAVLIALTRLNRILSVDPKTRRAVVEPGVQRAFRGGPASRPAVRTRPSSQTAVPSGQCPRTPGTHCLKAGVTTNHVTELEVILPDGSLARLGYGCMGPTRRPLRRQ